MNKMRKVKEKLKMLLYIFLVFILLIILFVNFAPVFGDKAKGASLDKIKESKYYSGKKFVNLVATKMYTGTNSMDVCKIINFFVPSKDKNPQVPLPSQKLDEDKFVNGSFVWLGHSTVLMKTNNITIITDPVFNGASPVPGIAGPFDYENPTSVDELPKIDVVLISHDHYDHLDYKTIKKLSKKADRFLVPLGVKAHLLRWGVKDSKIIEKDWYEDVVYQDISFTFGPTRHFSGRGITDRNSTLWGSWIIKSNSLNAYFGGDSGYFNVFKQIGDKYGPFDIAFLENGAYNEDWAHVHMMPEEVVQTNIDLKSKVLMPIHWGKFDLSYHNWDEPIIRVTKEAEKRDVSVAMPIIGEVFNLQKLPQTKWWEKLRS